MFKILIENEWARTFLIAVLAGVAFFSFVGIFFSVVKMVKKEWKIWYLIGTVFVFVVSMGLFILVAIKLGQVI